MLNLPERAKHLLQNLVVWDIPYTEVISLLNDSYTQPHRAYHNTSHINTLMSNLDDLYLKGTIDIPTYLELGLTALFHDVMYVPGSPHNERLSGRVFKACVSAQGYNVKRVYNSIIERISEPEKTDCVFNQLDRSVLSSNSIEELLAWENAIFKEYSRFSFKDYTIGRLRFLDSIRETPALNFLKTYVANRKIKVGVYAGSFAPFHKGHLEILQKAEQVFDKVIVARGENEEKNVSSFSLSKVLPNHETHYYEGSLPNFIESLEDPNVEYTLVRGLRNGLDLEYEFTLASRLKDFAPQLQIVYIKGDAYNHVSSSWLRGLSKRDSTAAYQYTVRLPKGNEIVKKIHEWKSSNRCPCS